jgi:myosin-7
MAERVGDSDWTKVSDPTSGKTYYANTVTQATSWEVPDEIKDIVNQGGSGDWVESTDPASGKTYYYNSVTKETSWTKPEGFSGGGGSDWESKVDPDSGRTYYFNRTSNETSWEKPACLDDGSAEPAAAATAEAAADEPAAAVVDTKESEEKFKKLREDSAKNNAKGKRTSVLEKKMAEAKQKKVQKEAIVEEVEIDEEKTMEKYAEERFNLKRKGVLKGKTTVEKILNWKADLIKSSLHQFPDDLSNEAVQAFKNVTGFMADRKSKKDNIEHAKKLLRNILPAAVELRDEVFCQIIKQTTNNPSAESTLRGWQLMAICLGAFPPSPTFGPYLKTYCNTIKEEGAAELAEYAGFCLQSIDKIQTIGHRHEVPTTAELEFAQSMQKLEHKIYFLDGTFKEVAISPWDTSAGLGVKISQSLGITLTDEQASGKVPQPYALYEINADDDEERLLEDNEVVLDLLATWDRLEADERAKRGKSAKPTEFKLVFKVHLFFDVAEEDTEGISLMYIQAVHDVVDHRYPSSEQDNVTLAALQLQQEFGDCNESANLLEGNLVKYLPAQYLNKGREEELEERIMKVYQKLAGYSEQEAKLSYLDLVKSWEIYGSEYFFVEPAGKKPEFDSEVVIAVNAKAIIVVEPETKEFLKKMPYSEVVTWGHSASTFVIVQGNMTQQKKLYFKTDQGKEINDLVTQYVNAISALGEAAEE